MAFASALPAAVSAREATSATAAVAELNGAALPATARVSHVYRPGAQRVSVQALARCYLESTDQGPEWGARLNITLLHPK